MIKICNGKGFPGWACPRLTLALRGRVGEALKVEALATGGLLVCGEVSAAGANLKFLVAGRMRHDADRAVTAVGARVGRFIGDGVLVADVVGYGLAHLIHFLQVLRKECYSTCLQGQRFQGALESLGIAFLAQDADGVDRGSVLVLDGTNGLLQRFPALVVVAVGDEKQHFLLPLRESTRSRASRIKLMLLVKS